MSSVVTGVLSSTVCLLWNKASDGTTVKLKDAYITDAQIRETVVQELTKIQTKLDGLSRKDLHMQQLQFLTRRRRFDECLPR
jgi:hypothetical protein